MRFRGIYGCGKHPVLLFLEASTMTLLAHQSSPVGRDDLPWALRVKG